MLDFVQARRLMVDCQLRTFDVNDVPVLDAFAVVPRERYVALGREDFAYTDQTQVLANSDGDSRVMPAPMILARMIQALAIQPGVRALDVATGNGYGAALLVQLKAHVDALECLPALAERARERLGDSVNVLEGPLDAPELKERSYGAILVEGRVETRPVQLLRLLKDDGRLVCVLGPDRAAKATLFVRAGDAFGWRPLFDASLPALKAFAEAPDFVF